MSRKTRRRRTPARHAECEHARVVTIECAVQYLTGCIEGIEQRMAEIAVQARLAATAQVIGLVKAELERSYDDTPTEALYRVMERLEGEQQQ